MHSSPLTIEAAKIPLLAPEEEAALFAALTAGDENAKHEIVRRHIRYVGKIGRLLSLQFGLESTDDLVAEGVLGLYKAITSFDPTRGPRFIAYALPAVRQSMFASLQRCESCGDMSLDHDSFYERDASYFESRVSIKDTCHEGLADPETLEVEARVIATIDASSIKNKVLARLTALPAKQQQIIRRRFFDAVSLKNAGKGLGRRNRDLTRERSRQLQAAALASLRETLAS